VIPYLNIPPLELGPIKIHLFGVLVAIGILLGASVTIRRARERKLDEPAMRSAITWLLVGGFIVAHLVALLAYEPHRIVNEPWSILMFWSGISSYGGFLGAFLGLYFFVRRKRLPFGPYADAVALGLLPGWIFGRLGCYTAHDHPGLPTDFFLAVKYPDGPRHDLGFYELLYTIVLFALFEWIRRRSLPAGRLAQILGILYAPVRFALDFLRSADARYLGLTPAQYASILLFGLCVFLLVRPARPAPATGRRVEAAR
jgi:phosphatidylglycerol:prolipoprotein diacylglycerol transferase